MEKLSYIRDGFEYFVSHGDCGRSWTWMQKVNPKTGRGWQRQRDMEVHTSRAKAMVRWCKMARRAA